MAAAAGQGQEETNTAGEVSPPSKALTGPRSAWALGLRARGVCAPIVPQTVPTREISNNVVLNQAPRSEVPFPVFPRPAGRAAAVPSGTVRFPAAARSAGRQD